MRLYKTGKLDHSTFVTMCNWTMWSVLGFLLLLVGLSQSETQAGGGGLGQQGETSECQKTAPGDAVEEPTDQSAKQTVSDIWAELRALRDMMVELKVEVKVKMENMEARVKESETLVDALKVELMVTKVHMELLQKEQSDFLTRLNSSESELAISKAKIDQLEKQNAVQATELISLGERLTANERKTSALENMRTRLSSSEEELVASRSRIDRLERENAEKPKVAFYTSLTNAGPIGPFNTDIPLKYSKVFTNTGNAYSPVTGFFTAPVKGVYYFQFTVFGFYQHLTAVSLYKNDEKMLHNWDQISDKVTEYFTNSVIFELMAGDEIHLVLPSGYSIYDGTGNYSTFSGSLLFTL